MKRFLFAVCLAAFSAVASQSGVSMKDAYLEDGTHVDARRIVPGAKDVLPADWFVSNRRPLASGLDGLSLQVLRIVSGTGVTNVSARAYRRTSIYYAITGGPLGNPTNYFPYVSNYFLTRDGFSERTVAFQDPAVYLKDYSFGGTTYPTAWRSDCWTRSDIGTAYFVASVPEEGDATYRDGYPLAGNSDEDYERGISVLVSGDGEEWQYVMVNEKGEVNPSNILATAALAAQVEAQLLMASQAAVVQSNAYETAKTEVNRIAEAIANAQITIYQDDYVYSFGEVVSVSPNCRCRVYRFDADVGTTVVDGNQYKMSDVYFGFTEDIGSLNPVALLKSSLAADSLDWEEALVDEPDPVPGHTFERDGDVYAHCYSMRVYVPTSWNAAFIKIFTEITGTTGDGSTIDIAGGVVGGLTGTLTVGDRQVDFIGGFAMAPEEE